MSYIEYCIIKFYKLPSEIQTTLGGEDAVRALQALELKYQIDLKFILILVVIGELQISDIPEYLIKKFDLAESIAIKIRQEMVNEVFSLLLVTDIDKNKIYKEDLKNFFTGEIKKLLNQDSELLIEINEKFLYVILYDINFNEELLNNLYNNKTIFTETNLQLENKKVSGTVANWLRLFISLFGLKEFNGFTLANFFTQVKEIKNISQSDKNNLESLLKIYRNLKFFPEVYLKNNLAFEDFKLIPIAKIYEQKVDLTILENDISKKEDNDKKEKILQDYIKYQKFINKIILKSEILLKEPDKSLHGKFHQVINDKDKSGIYLFLFIFAKQGNLDEIFERDDKIKEIFKKHLAKKFTEKIANHFEKNLREPVYLSYFLQHILKDILKLDENESAVLAIKLVNELKRAGDKQYLPIAYGDLKEGIFKWKGIVEKDDKLELEK